MTNIECNGIKFNVPESWKDITLGEYEKYYNISPKTYREQADLVAAVCNLDVLDLLAFPAELFNIIAEKIGFILEDLEIHPSQSFDYNGIKYHVSTGENITLGEWVDMEEAQKSDSPLISALAIVCRPAGEPYDYKKNEEREGIFRAVTMDKLLPILCFFLQCRKTYEASTEIFSALRELASRLPSNTRFFQNLGAGIKWYRIWHVTKFLILNGLLRYRLRRFLRFCNIEKIKK